jgi:hypothetical protein
MDGNLEGLLEQVKKIDGDYHGGVSLDTHSGDIDFDHLEEEIMLIKVALMELLCNLLKEKENGHIKTT